MSRFAFLILPSSNRVYAAATVALAVAELEVFNQAAMGGRICEVGSSDIGGVRYITFTCDDLTERNVDVLANLSSLYALYRIEGDMLRPLALRRLDRLDDDLITIQKYPGKTNEQFTKLLLNVTLLSSSFATEMLERKFSVLDPLCGRGTTLNQALMYGFDAYGVEMDKQDVEAYSAFIQRWLKDKRLKHQASFGPVRRDRQIVARRLQVSFAPKKEDYKAGIVQHIDVVSAETTKALQFFRPESVDLVVTDAPYGIQHGSRAQGKGLTRSPLNLIAEAAPVWARILRPGGAIGISWNTFVARREDATATLATAGLQVMDSGPYLGFRHRVDQAIMRDVLVAHKPLTARDG